jgi:hypothetical protein
MDGEKGLADDDPERSAPWSLICSELQEGGVNVTEASFGE